MLDECDSLMGTRGNDEDNTVGRVKTELMLEIESLQKSTDVCILVCATNRPSQIDPAFISRFRSIHHLPLPEKDDREEMIKNEVASLKIKSNFSDEFYKMVADRTDGFSFRDLRNLIDKSISFGPMHKTIMASHFTLSEVEDEAKFEPCFCHEDQCGIKMNHRNILPDAIIFPELTEEDLEKGFSEINPNNSEEVVKENENFAKKVGRLYQEEQELEGSNALKFWKVLKILVGFFFLWLMIVAVIFIVIK